MFSSLEYTDNLQALMAGKVDVLEQLCELARQQSAVTGVGDAALLLSFLARKQPLMDRLAELQEALQIYAHDEPEERRWRSAADRHTCRAASDRCQHLLAEIVLLEKQSLDEMSARRDALAAHLQDGRDGNSASQAYHMADSLDEGSLDLTAG